MSIIVTSLFLCRCLVFGSGNDLSNELKGKSGFILIDPSNQNNQLSFIQSQILQIIKHCITVIYSNITMLLGDKKSQKKAGSLPHSTDTPPDEDELRSVISGMLVIIIIITGGSYTVCNSVYIA